ncbi:MAG: phytoene desaturase [Parvicellaceae bacterium]
MKSIAIIGSGFSSLSSACYLAKEGYDVTVFEKNADLGGRARVLEIDGFRYDMGPSWYWMPDVFDRFFKDFGKQTSDFYELIRLDPAYKVFFKEAEPIEIPASLSELKELFESIEVGSGEALTEFLNKAEYNYKIAIETMVYKPGVNASELVSGPTVKNMGQFVSNIRTQIRKRFKNERLIQILEFPVLFLGAKPEDTPAFYNFMNYADLVLGTWYPKGGMHEIVKAMVSLGQELGVEFRTSSNVQQILVQNKQVIGLKVNNLKKVCDVVLSGADYHHTETLLAENNRAYSEKYWNKKIFAPSALLFYVGFNKRIERVRHHNLFFDEDFDTHAEEIYDEPVWPSAPLFYASFPSLTDDTVSPEGKECAFFLIPIAPDLKDDKERAEQYFNQIIKRLEAQTKQELASHVMFKKSYSVSDFKADYNSYKGNAYGMANTLRQTAFLRPKIKSKKVKNLFFTGQLTVPGPGVPPAIISGKIASELIIRGDNKLLQP